MAVKRKRLILRRAKIDYNRLQALVDRSDGVNELMKLAGIGTYNPVSDAAAVKLMSLFDCQVSTLQMNYPALVSYRCSMTLHVVDGLPAYAVVVKPTLYSAVASAYLQCHKQLTSRSRGHDLLRPYRHPGTRS